MGWASAAFALQLIAAPSRADTLHLANSVDVQGVLIEETTDQLKLQVSDDGYAMYEKKEVVSIDRDTPAADETLRVRWRHEAERQAADEDDDAESDDAESDDASEPAPAAAPQVVTNVVINVNEPGSSSLGYTIGPGFVRGTPRGLLNPGLDLGPANILLNRTGGPGPSVIYRNNGPGPGNIFLNRR